MVLLPTDSGLEQVYPIVEIFHSVQGEGYHTGEASVFIRFGRCNLRCPWCDTEFDEWEDMTLGQLIDAVTRFDCDRVILTGGEPALHDLPPLCNSLKAMGYYISIETNGTIALPTDIIDWVCVSPKDQEYPDVAIRQREGDELKVVYLGQDMSMYDELKEGFQHHFLQPCYDEGQSVEWNGLNFHQTFEVVKSYPAWRLSLQTHKWMCVE